VGTDSILGKDLSIGAKLMNARAETITQKPSFKNAFAQRRCLIPAAGFYEWKKEGNKKIPYYFLLKSGKPLGFARLYETWIAPDKNPVKSCTIITTQANAVVEPIHDRMPVVAKDARDIWLNPE
jgi:putative SOS response-associated peptidase YedK